VQQDLGYETRHLVGSITSHTKEAIAGTDPPEGKEDTSYAGPLIHSRLLSTSCCALQHKDLGCENWSTAW
jgi:hypothetical protein